MSPLPSIDELLRSLGGSKVLRVLDLASGFFQEAIEPDSIPLTAVCTQTVLCGWLRMPMGVSGSSGRSQRLTAHVCEDLQRVCHSYALMTSKRILTTNHCCISLLWAKRSRAFTGRAIYLRRTNPPWDIGWEITLSRLPLSAAPDVLDKCRLIEPGHVEVYFARASGIQNARSLRIKSAGQQVASIVPPLSQSQLVSCCPPSTTDNIVEQVWSKV